MRLLLVFIVPCLFCLPASASTEVELGAYLGLQSAGSSTLQGTDPGGAGPIDGSIGWEGRSDRAPIYYGFRGTWWRGNGYGIGLEFTHAKAYADEASRNALGFERLELTHGLNFLTVNLARRWPLTSSRVVPFVSAGVGVTVPHVDVQSAGGRTLEYQLTGPAVQWGAGAFLPLGERWLLLAEYKGTYSWNEIDLPNGGRLDTKINTNAFNLGVSYRFPRR